MGDGDWWIALAMDWRTSPWLSLVVLGWRTSPWSLTVGDVVV